MTFRRLATVALAAFTTAVLRLAAENPAGLVATFGDDEPRPVPPSTSSTEAPVDKPEQGQIDLPTKRVKTIVVCPEDLSAAPGTP